MLKEFKEFAMKGNVIDLAVGIIIGAAFGTIIKSLVDDILMPPNRSASWQCGLLESLLVIKEGKVAGPYSSLAAAKAAGAVSVNIGIFINTIISFLIVAFSVFLVIKNVNRMKKEPPLPDPATKDCPFCYSAIPIKATRCPNCTSELKT